MPESAILDPLDRQIIRALQVAPRAAFSHVAQVLGASEQTVARRYRRLRGDGIIRIAGLTDPAALGQSSWLVRAGCRPGGAGRLAEALARRDDVFWVVLSAGGSEIICSVQSRTSQQRDDLLLQRLPATSQVLSMAAHEVLHRFAGGSADDWTGFEDALTAGQARALQPPPDSAGDGLSAAGPILPEDLPLLDELARDGRASYADLAAAVGWTPGRAARRMAALRAAGALYFDVDLATELLGFASAAYLWLTVEPARLARVGEQLASHAEVPFVAAITGPANLIAVVLCRDTQGLYRYVTTKVSATAGVRQLEISPILRRLKQGGTRMSGLRLALDTGSRPAAVAR